MVHANAKNSHTEAACYGKIHVSMIKILISHHFKIQVRAFPNGHVQASISMSSNLKDKIHFEPELNVMT